VTEIPMNATVECTDGPCGQSAQLIVNPISRKVTHLVVEDEHLTNGSSRLVPTEYISDATHP
jgi:hypothetical protein